MNNEPRGALHPMQLHQLRQPINPERILKDGKGNSHLSQQDVVAQLTRIFGYGSFDFEILDLSLVYEDRYEKNGAYRYECCYKALVRLTVRNMNGELVAFYEDVSTDTAQGQKTRGDAHDLAAKSAVSLAKKRCAVHLGDGFGQSLYNSGSTTPIVVPMGTVTLPEHIAQQNGRGEESQDVPDMQAGVQKQHSMGNVDPESEPAVERDPADVQASLDRAGGQ